MQFPRRGSGDIIARALDGLICGSPIHTTRSPLPLLGVPEIGLVIGELLRVGKYRQLLLLLRGQCYKLTIF